MASLLEELLAKFSSFTFLKDFVFWGQKLHAASGETNEFCDIFIWLRNQAIVVQVKERDRCGSDEPNHLGKWFQKKVVTEGSRQIAETVRMRRRFPEAQVDNMHGREWKLKNLYSPRYRKLIVYGSRHQRICIPGRINFRISRRSGFIHFMDAFSLCSILDRTISPGEFLKYLAFRENLLRIDPRYNTEPEDCLFGTYVRADNPRPRDPTGVPPPLPLSQLVEDGERTDYRQFLVRLSEKMTQYDGPVSADHYNILLECCLMPRCMLPPFKECIAWCVKRLDNPGPPFPRIGSPGRGPVFVFGALDAGLRGKSHLAANLVLAGKYDLKRDVGIGFFFYRMGQADFWLENVIAYGPWKPDVDIENRLKKCPLFRPLRNEARPNYLIWKRTTEQD